jgi:hypothetical protein
MTQILYIYGQNSTYYCVLGVSSCRHVGKVCNEYNTFLHPTLDRRKWSVTLSTTSYYEKNIVSSDQISPRTKLERVMTNQPTGHRTHCQPPGSTLVGAGDGFDSQSKRQLY